MKSTGIVRRVDDLGRIVIPKELRRMLGIDVGDGLEVFITGEQIVLQKYNPGDIFTGETENLIDYKDKKVSVESIKEMAKLAGLRTW